MSDKKTVFEKENTKENSLTLLYKKEFIMNHNGGVILKNPEIALSYAEGKIQELINTRDHPEAQRKVKCQVFSEFRTVYEYDCENAIVPEPFGEFVSQEAKEHFVRLKILYEDFQLYLGTIFITYHNQLAELNEIKLMDASPMVIDYNELFGTALAEYIRVLLRINHPVQMHGKSVNEPLYTAVEYRGKEIMIPTGSIQRQPHACAATFILPSLIEHFLLIYLENTVIDQWLKGVNRQSLDPEERDIYDKFVEMKKLGYGVLTGDRKRIMKRIWDMGTRCGVFSNDRAMREILCGKDGNFNTLGVILKSTYARAHIRSEYLTILDYMFDKKMLNLRNSIAHGISTTYDYLSLAFVAVMVQLIWDMGTNDVILGYFY